MILDTWEGVTRPKVASPMRTAGARAQQPIQRTTSRVNSMSSVANGQDMTQLPADTYTGTMHIRAQATP